ncbi:hypothetical protein [Scytonema sp. UIC 10036]|nr:hypothetical protein [Scytonema sp. UIC 10036]
MFANLQLLALSSFTCCPILLSCVVRQIMQLRFGARSAIAS